MRSDLFAELMSNLSMLSESQKLELMEALQDAPTSDEPIAEITKCPLCESDRFVKNGHRKGRQRFICKNCGKTFGTTNNTARYHSRLSDETINKIIESTVHGHSMATISKDTGISKTSAFLNRHKLLAAVVASEQPSRFGELSEADEYFTTMSFKGRRNLGFFLNTLGRMPRHHRSRAQKVAYLERNGFNPDDYDDIVFDDMRKRGISNEQICVLTCAGHDGSSLLQPVCVGRLERKYLDITLKGKIKPNTVLVTDSHSAYRKYCKENGIHLEQIPSGKHSRGAFNLAQVNSLHSRLDYFLKAYRQVGSKYLEGYISLFGYLDKTSKQTTQQRVNGLNEFVNCGRNIKRVDLKKKSLCFDTKGLFAA